MKKTIVFASLSFCLLYIVTSCKNDTPSEDYLSAAVCTSVVDSANTYTTAIKAILDTQCATSGCHNAASAKEGVNLSDYANAKTAFQSKDALCTIHHGSGCTPMPQGGSKLSDALIQKIDCWGKNGYKQ
jgi:hypothetical protein